MTRDLHALLRQQTADLHRRLDSAPALLTLMRPGLTLSGYAEALRRYEAAHAGVEPALQALAPACPPGLPPYRSRLPALLQGFRGLAGFCRSGGSREQGGDGRCGFRHAAFGPA